MDSHPDNRKPAAQPNGSDPLQEKRQRRRRIALRSLMGIIIIVAVVAGVWYWLIGRWYESTDDAYVDGNVVQITPQIPGTVIGIGADDNDFVRKGEVLVKLDASDTRLALRQAEAALAQTVRRVSGLYTSVRVARADVAVRETSVRLAEADYRRRRGLAKSGAISTEELAHAREALAAARSALAATRAQLATTAAMVVNTAVASHPDVRAAAAKVRAAWLDDIRTTLVAPVSGYVAKRTVQVGQRVQPGTPLMAVVPLHEVWVDANFKETQLDHMRIGQPVTLTCDLYGGHVTYHGRIAGLGIGTGSAFSLLPAQNASGNWIKIVQRLPVRIDLQPDELAHHPLRIGLSMDAHVDLHDQSGMMLANQPRRAAAFSTDVYARDPTAIDAMIAKIIRENDAVQTQATHDGVAAARQDP